MAKISAFFAFCIMLIPACKPVDSNADNKNANNAGSSIGKNGNPIKQKPGDVLIKVPVASHEIQLLIQPSAQFSTYVFTAQTSLRLARNLEDWSQLFRWPINIPLTFKDCGGEVNAFWDGSSKTMTFCYELLADFQHTANEVASQSTRSLMIEDLMIATIAHELGHAAKDLFKLPVVGNEETAADQFATLLLIPGSTPSPDDKSNLQSIMDFAEYWWWSGKKNAPGFENYSDEHPVDPQRAANLFCLIYGASATDWFIKDGFLSESRAPKCERELESVYDSYSRMLKPFLR